MIAGDRVVFGSEDGRVYVLDLATGKRVWSYEIGEAIMSSPAVTGGWLVIAATDGYVYAFAARREDDR